MVLASVSIRFSWLRGYVSGGGAGERGEFIPEWQKNIKAVRSFSLLDQLFHVGMSLVASGPQEPALFAPYKGFLILHLANMPLFGANLIHKALIWCVRASLVSPG